MFVTLFLVVRIVGYSFVVVLRFRSFRLLFSRSRPTFLIHWVPRFTFDHHRSAMPIHATFQSRFYHRYVVPDATRFHVYVVLITLFRLHTLTSRCYSLVWFDFIPRFCGLHLHCYRHLHDSWFWSPFDRWCCRSVGPTVGDFPTFVRRVFVTDSCSGISFDSGTVPRSFDFPSPGVYHRTLRLPHTFTRCLPPAFWVSALHTNTEQVVVHHVSRLILPISFTTHHSFRSRCHNASPAIVLDTLLIVLIWFRFWTLRSTTVYLTSVLSDRWKAYSDDDDLTSIENIEGWWLSIRWRDDWFDGGNCWWRRWPVMGIEIEHQRRHQCRRRHQRPLTRQ